jgi:hypothetical protein
MRRVNAWKAFSVILVLLYGQILVSLLDLCWINLVSFFKLLSVNCIVFREVDINKTCQRMAVCSYSNISFMVVMLEYDLFIYSVFFLSLVINNWGPSSLEILLDFVCLIFVEFFFLSFEFHLFLVFVILLRSSDFFLVLFFELHILPHDLIHILVVNINIHHLLALLKCMVFLV